MMEKQKNRGQDGAGYASIKFDLSPGQKYLYRVRSYNSQAIHDVFKKINKKIFQFYDSNKSLNKNSKAFYSGVPFIGQVMLGHVRYGTYGKNSIDYVQPVMRQNNWMHRNLILAGNFNMSNNDELFESLVKLGQHPKEQSDTITIMEKIGHFLVVLEKVYTSNQCFSIWREVCNIYLFDIYRSIKFNLDTYCNKKMIY